MIMPVNIQLYYFLATILSGLLVGILFDIYRGVRAPGTKVGILTAISDVLFWVFCTLSVFVVFLYMNNGDFRYYTFIGMGMGLYLYFLLMSKVVRGILKEVKFFMGRFLRILFIVIGYPFKIIVYFIKYISYKCAAATRKIKINFPKKKEKSKK